MCIVAPTGAGKTRIGAAIARSALERGRRVVWIVHRRELIEQAAEAIGGRLSILRADDDRVDDGASLIVASTQTLIARGKPPPAQLVILDECHHYGSVEWSQLASSYSDSIRVGLTATPVRSDGVGLSHLFDSLIVAASYSQLIEAGHLCDIDVIAPPERIAGVAMNPADACAKYMGDRPSVAFVETVAQAIELSKEIGGFAIYGDMNPEVRHSALKAFAAGELRRLTTVFVLTEGWDAPRAEVCVLARGCSSVGTYMQICGRFLRPFPGKERALLIDLCGSVYIHGHPTADREFSLMGDPIRRKRKYVWQCRECGLVLSAAKSPCPRCGHELTPREVREIERAELRFFRKTIREPVRDPRALYIALQKVGHAKGYKPGWAAYAFKAKTGRWPDTRERHQG